jgi:thiamine pyrophosphokinase
MVHGGMIARYRSADKAVRVLKLDAWLIALAVGDVDSARAAF